MGKWGFVLVFPLREMEEKRRDVLNAGTSKCGVNGKQQYSLTVTVF